jgi:hypothetical protein
MGCRSNGLSELWVVGIMLRIRIDHLTILSGTYFVVLNYGILMVTSNDFGIQ